MQFFKYFMVKKMTDYFIDQGFTYFDTAWMYCGFNSESAVGEALVSRHPRDSFTLATKLHGGFFHTPEGMDDIFRQQLEKSYQEIRKVLELAQMEDVPARPSSCQLFTITDLPFPGGMLMPYQKVLKKKES